MMEESYQRGSQLGHFLKQTPPPWSLAQALPWPLAPINVQMFKSGGMCRHLDRPTCGLPQHTWSLEPRARGICSRTLFRRCQGPHMVKPPR